MALTSDQLALARSWIGNWEDEAAFTARFDRLGEDLDVAILESMRAHRAKLLDQAARIGIEDLSLDFSATIQAISNAIKEFRKLGGTAGASRVASGVTKLQRDVYR